MTAATTVFLVEQQDAVQALKDKGLRAVNVEDEQTWPALAASLKGAEAVLIPRNDVESWLSMRHLAASLVSSAMSLKCLELPECPDGHDVLDWLNAGHTVDELTQLAERTNRWEPTAALDKTVSVQPGDALENSVNESGISVPILSPAMKSAKTLPTNDSSISGICGISGLEPWDVPIPLQANIPRPPFPVETLPKWLRQWVEAESVATQTPPDLAGCLAIGVLSACLANAVIVQPKRDWREITSLYMIVGMESGERKSPVFRDATNPIEVLERENIEAMRLPLAKALAEKDVLEKRLTVLKEKAARGKVQMEEVHDARAQLEALHLPESPRYLAEDVTVERLASLLATQQSTRLAVMSAEGSFFANVSGRYSNQPTFDILLKAYTSEPFRVDRQGRAPDFIDKPALSLVLAVQPSVIQDLSAFAPFKSRGLLARILYSLPLSWVGNRAVDPPSVPDNVQTQYDHVISHLFAWGLQHANDHDPITLTLSTGAYKQFLLFWRELEPRLGHGGDLSNLAGWGNKTMGTVLRLAAILHYATVPANYESRTIIDSQTIQSAISLAQYFMSHAQAAFGLMALDPDIQEALSILDHLKSHEQLLKITYQEIQETSPDSSADPFEMIEITERNLYRSMKSQFPHARDIKTPLALLMEHGYLQRQPLENQPARGRPPSPNYWINPFWYRDRNATNAIKPENPMGMRVLDDPKTVTELGQKSQNQGQKSIYLQQEAGLLKEATANARF